MADISASFTNNYGDSRMWIIWDMGRDPNAPPVVFNNYLDPGQSTGSLSFYSDDGIYGRAQYQRSDGAPTSTDVSDGSTVNME